MSWNFCSKSGGAFLWQGVLVFFINGRIFLWQGYWNFFFQWQWIFGVRVYVFFESIGEFYRIRV